MCASWRIFPFDIERHDLTPVSRLGGAGRFYTKIVVPLNALKKSHSLQPKV
jgi:hypothetical protein